MKFEYDDYVVPNKLGIEKGLDILFGDVEYGVIDEWDSKNNMYVVIANEAFWIHEDYLQLAIF